MSPIKKSDVKNHLSARNRTGIHLYRPESQPNATGFAGEGSESAHSQMKDSAEKSLDQPAPNQLDAPLNATESDSSDFAASVTFKSARS